MILYAACSFEISVLHKHCAHECADFCDSFQRFLAFGVGLMSFTSWSWVDDERKRLSRITLKRFTQVISKQFNMGGLRCARSVGLNA